MLSFCINTLHFLLPRFHWTKTPDHSPHSSSPSHHFYPHCCNSPCGLKLLTEEVHSPTNVLETVVLHKHDSYNEMEFLRNSAGSVMEAMSFCTESLGFESCDQSQEQVTQQRSVSKSRFRSKRSFFTDRRTEQAKNKIFPPPLTSLNRNGHPSTYLKSVRNNGRLEITEVRIDRPEFLRASRQDGRLTLHLIQPVVDSIKDDHEKLNESVEESVIESVNESVELIEEDVKDSCEESEEEADDERWKFTLPSEIDITRRCYEVSHRGYQYHHHNQESLWSNHWVMTG